ncbi:hypothetical protein KIPB_002908 [Kipferlia bialata]|uniref:Uncharacterized protein n=1 Tax=Kipferlia bialata TaxID=797122 RepID=A0A9K3CRE2_9EUKA|nr:hypothetical protein KIPB_002908 [Kipferlia bialata]|eukprot:g2908.t1
MSEEEPAPGTVEAILGGWPPRGISDGIVHMDTLDLTSSFYVFASPYMAERVYATLYKRDKKNLMFYMAMKDRDQHYSLKAELLVYHAARMIALSRRFRIRPLTPNAPGRNPAFEVLRLGPYNMVRYFDPVPVMAMREGMHIDCRVDRETGRVKEHEDLHTYYQYQHKYDRHYLANDPVVVDGLDKRGCLFIHTTLSHFQIDLTSVLESVAAMDNPTGPVRLYLCMLPFNISQEREDDGRGFDYLNRTVLQRMMHSMTAQPYVTGTGDNKLVLPPDTVPNVTQYLLELSEGYDNRTGRVRSVPDLPDEENDLVLNDEGQYENIVEVYTRMMKQMLGIEEETERDREREREIMDID